MIKHGRRMQKMARLKYDAVDKEIRQALQNGIHDYKTSIDERVAEIRGNKSVTISNKKSDLRKLAAFGRV